MYPVAEMLAENPIYQLSWQDDEKTIIIMRVTGRRWSWDDAHKAINELDAAVRSVDHPVYVIYFFEVGTNILPQGAGLLNNLRQLMGIYAPNTAMIFFVRSDPSLRAFSQVVARTFQLTGRNYFFVRSMNDAQARIMEQKQSQPVKP